MLHELSFEGKGETQNVIVEIDEGEDIENKQSLKLAQKMAFMSAQLKGRMKAIS